jgi:hypothetical protein
MNTIEFMCYEQGFMTNKPLVSVQVPAECCGIKTKIHPSFNHMFASTKDRCEQHMNSYSDVWKYFFNEKIHLKGKAHSLNGMDC